MSKRSFLPAAALLTAIGVAACTAGGIPATSTPTATPSGAPTEAPTATPTPVITGIAHPTGADEIVLRLDYEGGFVPPEFLAARVPPFTLYGDGRVVFVQTTAVPPERDIAVGQPLRTALLSEEQLQSLLEFALGDGGLAVARDEYTNPMIADAPMTVFTINADNDSKTVKAMGLGFEQQPSPDSQVLQRLSSLAERLNNFDQGGSIASDQYEAPAYRGVLTDATGAQGVPVHAWPWDDIAVSDFTFPADANALQQGKLALTAEQVAALEVDGYQNGIAGGLWVRADAGKLYSLVVRPLLPDEDK
jgi:hypothetical protein